MERLRSLWQQLSEQIWFRKLVFVWRTWGWSALTSVFGVACLVAGWNASQGTEPRVRMAFLVFALTFFLYVFFRYFFVVADFSSAHRLAERQQMKKPPPRTLLIVLYLLLGCVSVVALVGLLWWRHAS